MNNGLHTLITEHPIVTESIDELRKRLEELERQKREEEEEFEKEKEDEESGPINPFSDKDGIADGFEKDLEWEGRHINRYLKHEWWTIYKWLPKEWQPFLKVLDGLRWLANAWGIGVPYSLYIVLSVAFNVMVNIDWNHYWAGGNLFLLANTAYLLSQAFFSTLLMFEVNIVL